MAGRVLPGPVWHPPNLGWLLAHPPAPSGGRMNRKDFISIVATKAGVPPADADKVLTAFQDVVCEVVADGKDKLTLPGFLTFEQGARAAREGRNPATGEAIHIAATKTAKVTAGSKLKAAAVG